MHTQRVCEHLCGCIQTCASIYHRCVVSYVYAFEHIYATYSIYMHVCVHVCATPVLCPGVQVHVCVSQEHVCL